MYLLDNKEILLQLGVPIDAVHVSIVDERERSKLLQVKTTQFINHWNRGGLDRTAVVVPQARLNAFYSQRRLIDVPTINQERKSHIRFATASS